MAAQIQGSKVERRAARGSQGQPAFLNQRAFVELADWRLVAVGNLAMLPHASDDPRWISERLGVSEKEAEEALARLVELGYVERHEGKLKQSRPLGPFIVTEPDERVDQYLQTLLRRGTEAVATLPEKRRLTLLRMLPLDTEFLSQLETLIWKFFEKADSKSRLGTPDEVFCLCVNLFPVNLSTEPPKEQE